MTQYIVTNVYDGLNLRPSPSTSGTPIKTMALGTLLELIEDTGTRWKKVRIVGSSPVIEGYASDVYLTEVRSDAIARLIASAAHYWELFDRGSGTEDKPPYKGYVLQMWDELGQGRPPGDNTSHRDWPWSAAGMSAFIRRAEGYTGFKYNAGHALYINDAIVKMKANKPAPFWGYRINEKKPEVGDLVAQWRDNRIDYDHAATHSSFKSHTDVVCQVLDGSVRAIGANVPTDTVGVKVYKLTTDGYLAGERSEIAILKNRA
ncbi:DUF2272 domain-containing protein [Inquilinus sp. CA228]|uniref:DUF2272 domain-containing protein n=1 Tax=Inquilinus sp. CA228 TaxID=3455609 RepID=UPI003F8D26CE